VLVCINGKGYTYTWPRAIGMTPWKDGKADQVYRQDYETVGLVTAAPYGGDWFHAHFGVSKEPLRLIGWYGPNNHRKDRAGVPGEKDTDEGAIDVTEGGTAIPIGWRIPSCARNTRRRSSRKAWSRRWTRRSTCRRRHKPAPRRMTSPLSDTCT
jgi:hypothetical protein